jgi:hypothetical protein
VLIDGVFESQPSVWHQELRIALAEGVHLLGASSMGALRAVELSRYGMIGVGAVYRAYAGGRLMDDADVALLHAAEEHDYRPLTVPLVNVIAVAEHAVAEGQLSRSEGRALVQAARRLHYRDRHWREVLAQVPWSAHRKERFEQFRKAHLLDVKAADARECLLVARELCATGQPAATIGMSALSVWARRAWFGMQGPPAGDGEPGLKTLLLAEWARSLGLAPSPQRVAFFERRAHRLRLDAGLLRSCAEALALEEQVLRRPELLAAQAPSLEEGRWVEAVRATRLRPRRKGREKSRD